MEILFTCPPCRSIEHRIPYRRAFAFAFLTGFFTGFFAGLGFATGFDGLLAIGAGFTAAGALAPYFLFSRSQAFLASAVPGQASGQKQRSIVHQSCFTPEWAFSSWSTGPKSTLPVKNGLCVDVWSSCSEPSESISWMWLIRPRSF